MFIIHFPVEMREVLQQAEICNLSVRSILHSPEAIPFQTAVMLISVFEKFKIFVIHENCQTICLVYTKNHRNPSDISSVGCREWDDLTTNVK